MNYKRVIAALFVVSALAVAALFVGCKSSSPQETVQTITNVEVSQLDKLLEANPNMQIVDVRTKVEYDAGFISGAILIDVTQNDFLERASTILDPKKPVLVYCRSGGRSLKAAKMLAAKNFTVYNLNGGYTAYVAYKQR